MSKIREVEKLISGLFYQYPTGVSTFNVCDCKRLLARGSGKCAQCLETKLAEIVGDEPARQLHRTVIDFADARAKVLEIAEEIK